MPAGQPSVPGGLDRRNLLLETDLLNAGSDRFVTFKSCIFETFRNQGVIGGNNSYVGFIADFRQGKVIQSAALPSSVGLLFDISSLHVNEIDNGIIVLSNGESARSNDNGISWTLIASVFTAFATTAIDVLAWRGAQLISANTKQTIPDRNYSVSTDNGLTWAGQFFSGAVIGSARKLRKSPDGGLLAMVGQNGRLDTTVSADLTAAAWTNFDFTALFGVGIPNLVDVAFNSDGSKAVCISQNGDIIVSIDGLATWSLFNPDFNFFKSGLTDFRATDFVVYLAALDGFFIGNRTSCAFIPGDGILDTMTVSNTLGLTALGTIEDSCSMSDGTDVLMPSNDNAFITAKPLV